MFFNKLIFKFSNQNLIADWKHFEKITKYIVFFGFSTKFPKAKVKDWLTKSLFYKTQKKLKQKYLCVTQYSGCVYVQLYFRLGYVLN